MKKGLLLGIFMTIACVFLQTSVLPALGIIRVAPNLVIAALVPTAILFGPMVGISLGLGVGLVLDLLTGFGLGLSVIPLCIAGMLAGLAKHYMNNEHFLMSMAVSGVAVVIVQLVSMLAMYFSRMIIAISWGSFFGTVLTIIFTMMASGIFHIWIHYRYSDGGRTRRSLYLN